jgi:hypothetical protein
VLTNPGVMAQFFSNLAFRRVRWVQETFACTAFPTELRRPRRGTSRGRSLRQPVADRERSPAPRNGGTIDFHDTSAVICANCHSTMNHMAPLFANFDDAGQPAGDHPGQDAAAGHPLALRTDWLPGAEPTAWRFGKLRPPTCRRSASRWPPTRRSPSARSPGCGTGPWASAATSSTPWPPCRPR